VLGPSFSQLLDKKSLTLCEPPSSARRASSLSDTRTISSVMLPLLCFKWTTCRPGMFNVALTATVVQATLGLLNISVLCSLSTAGAKQPIRLHQQTNCRHGHLSLVHDSRKLNRQQWQRVRPAVDSGSSVP